MSHTDFDTIYMERAINLARLGLDNVSTNPHVGAVIVHNGRIIGEGFHRRFGQAHAEVNAIGSVSDADRRLLPESTIYVTLEPCAHYGKTPPCSKLIIDNKLRRVVIGCVDPNPKVDGGGIAMMRNAGIRVDVMQGAIAERCRMLDPKFMSRFNNRRPFITLKWAQSADGFMARKDGSPERFSTPLTQTLVHKLRGEHDVILTSAATVITDNPKLDCRFWSASKAPQIAVIDRRQRLDLSANILSSDCQPIIYTCDIDHAIHDLGQRGYNSILVEAGPTLLNSLISMNLWDMARIEISPRISGDNGGFKAPSIPKGTITSETIDGNMIYSIVANPLN